MTLRAVCPMQPLPKPSSTTAVSRCPGCMNAFAAWVDAPHHFLEAPPCSSPASSAPPSPQVAPSAEARAPRASPSPSPVRQRAASQPDQQQQHRAGRERSASASRRSRRSSRLPQVDEEGIEDEDEEEHLQVYLQSRRVQSHLDVLMQAFLKTQGRAVPAAFEQPKGVHSLFVKLVCVPSFVDARAILQALGTLLLKLSQLVVLLSFLIAPALLWALREMARPYDGRPALEVARAVGPAAIAALLFMLGAEAIVKRHHQAQVARTIGLLTAANIPTVVPLTSSPQPAADKTPDNPATAAAAGTAAQAAPNGNHTSAPGAPRAGGDAGSSSRGVAPGTTPAAEGSSSTTQAPPAAAAAAAATPAAANAATGASASPAGSMSRAGTSGSGTRAAAAAAAAGASSSGADWGTVRQLVIKLEFEVFGNELNEGVLPSDVLPSRVHKLCEEVGVAFPTGGATGPAALLSLLESVKSVIGV